MAPIGQEITLSVNYDCTTDSKKRNTYTRQKLLDSQQLYLGDNSSEDRQRVIFLQFWLTHILLEIFLAFLLRLQFVFLLLTTRQRGISFYIADSNTSRFQFQHLTAFEIAILKASTTGDSYFFNKKYSFICSYPPLLCSFSYRRLPLAQLVNVPDINMVMAPIAATLMDNHREQLVGVIRFLSISLQVRNT